MSSTQNRAHDSVSDTSEAGLTLLLSSGFLLISSLGSCCCGCSLQAADWTGVSDRELVRGPDRQTHCTSQTFGRAVEHTEITETVYLYTCKNSAQTHGVQHSDTDTQI